MDDNNYLQGDILVSQGVHCVVGASINVANILDFW